MNDAIIQINDTSSKLEFDYVFQWVIRKSNLLVIHSCNYMMACQTTWL